MGFRKVVLLEKDTFHYFDELCNSNIEECTCPFCKTRFKFNESHSCSDWEREFPPIFGVDEIRECLPEHLHNVMLLHCESTFDGWEYRSERYEHELSALRIIKRDHPYGYPKLTDKGLVVYRKMPLYDYVDWHRNYLQQRRDSIAKSITTKGLNPVFLELEQFRHQQLYNKSMSFYRIKLEGHTIVMMLNSELIDNVELENLTDDLNRKRYFVSEIKYDSTIENYGYLMTYVGHYYQATIVNLAGGLKAYLFDQCGSTNVLCDIKRVLSEDHQFTKKERFIKTGRWRYEQKRLACSRKGIQLALKQGSKFGRPKGSVLSESQHLKKHSDIVNLLKSGASNTVTASKTKKSISTVKRVRAKLKMMMDFE